MGDSRGIVIGLLAARGGPRAPNAWDIARLGWLVASIATVGGALGSLLESDSAIREAIYRPRSARDPGG